MSPKVKKIVAREWLFFLLIFFLSPPLPTAYWWIKANRFLASSEFLIDNSLYHRVDWDDFIREITKGPITNRELVFGDSPKGGQQKGDISVYRDDKGDLVFKPGEGVFAYEKKTLLLYLYNSALDPMNYVIYVILTYPAFLFLRSVVWSVRTLRRKEVHPSN